MGVKLSKAARAELVNRIRNRARAIDAEADKSASPDAALARAVSAGELFQLAYDIEHDILTA